MAKTNIKLSDLPEITTDDGVKVYAKFTFIDLFAGMGGFRLAMQVQGEKCVFFSEWNAYSQKTYFAIFGEMPSGNIIKELTKSYIPKSIVV